MAVQPIPDGYRSITPYLVIRGAADAIEFYETAFGATELMRLDGPEGKVMHAEMKIGDSAIMMADEFPEMDIVSPSTLGNSPVGILLYVEDADTVFQRAIDAGATEKKPLVDQFYGDRSGAVVDPFGHLWTVATHIEDLSPEELNRRFEETMGGGAEDSD